MTDQPKDRRPDTAGRGLSRRAFIAVSGGVAAAPLPARAAELVPRPTDKRDVVLRDTDHIRTYYRLARS